MLPTSCEHEPVFGEVVHLFPKLDKVLYQIRSTSVFLLLEIILCSLFYDLLIFHDNKFLKYKICIFLFYSNYFMPYTTFSVWF